MNIKFLEIGMALSCMITNAMTVDMPPYHILEKRLQQFGLEELTEKSDVIRRLAGTNQKPADIVVAVNELMADYDHQTWGRAAVLTKVPGKRIQRILLDIFLEDNQHVLKPFEGEIAGKINMQQFRMADADALRKRIEGLHLDHFVQKTTLVQDLGGSEQTSLGVVLALDRAIEKYYASLHRENISLAMLSASKESLDLKREKLLEAFLSDTPQALQELDELYREEDR